VNAPFSFRSLPVVAWTRWPLIRLPTFDFLLVFYHSPEMHRFWATVFGHGTDRQTDRRIAALLNAPYRRLRREHNQLEWWPYPVPLPRQPLRPAAHCLVENTQLHRNLRHILIAKNFREATAHKRYGPKNTRWTYGPSSRIFCAIGRSTQFWDCSVLGRHGDQDDVTSMTSNVHINDGWQWQQRSITDWLSRRTSHWVGPTTSCMSLGRWHLGLH